MVLSTFSQPGLHPTAPLSQSRTPDNCMTSLISTALQRGRRWPPAQGGQDRPGALPHICPRSLSHLLTHCARNCCSGSATGTVSDGSVKWALGGKQVFKQQGRDKKVLLWGFPISAFGLLENQPFSALSGLSFLRHEIEMAFPCLAEFDAGHFLQRCKSIEN